MPPSSQKRYRRARGNGIIPAPAMGQGGGDVRGFRWVPLGIGLVALLVAACAAPREGSSGPAAAARPPAGAATAPGAAAAGTVASATTAVPREAFHLGYPNLSLSYLPILMARDLGYYEEEGLDADLSLMRANVGQAALVSGEIEFTASIGSNIKMALQGAPIKTILLFAQAQVMSLVAQPQLRTPEQLRGKTVGVGVAGASVDLVARLILKHYGLEPQRDVSVVPVGDGAIQYQALQLGQMDAVVLSLPFPVLARREGFAIVANAPDLFKLPSGGVGTMQSTLEQRRDMVQRMARAQIRALQYVRTQPEAVAKFVEQFFDMDYQTARESYEFLLPALTATGEVDREALELQLDMERAEGTAVTMGYDQLVDVTVAANAARELGLRP
jgi:NitT/TauT family transport system substrate-binding protein